MTYELCSLSVIARDKDSDVWNSWQLIIYYMIETYDNDYDNDKWQWDMTMTCHSNWQQNMIREIMTIIHIDNANYIKQWHRYDSGIGMTIWNMAI